MQRVKPWGRAVVLLEVEREGGSSVLGRRWPCRAGESQASVACTAQEPSLHPCRKNLGNAHKGPRPPPTAHCTPRQKHSHSRRLDLDIAST